MKHSDARRGPSRGASVERGLSAGNEDLLGEAMKKIVGHRWSKLSLGIMGVNVICALVVAYLFRAKGGVILAEHAAEAALYGRVSIFLALMGFVAAVIGMCMEEPQRLAGLALVLSVLSFFLVL